MMKLKIGITGQAGFVATHLQNYLNLQPSKYELVPFERDWFDDESQLDAFTGSCEVIVHLAGMNRHPDPQVIHDTNIRLSQVLVDSLKRTKSHCHVLFSSSTQESRSNLYGNSKKEARRLIEEWAQTSTGGSFSGLIIPNVFGPFGKPFYNSVVATFCHQLNRNEEPKIDNDGELKLIYVGELIENILHTIDKVGKKTTFCETKEIPHTAEIKVSELLGLLNLYKSEYLEKGVVPEIKSRFELNLFNTFRCYMDFETAYPKSFISHVDNRGAFIELARTGVPGQSSFSITVPGVTRGNHYHTRKIERFAVIKGKALIQLRKVGTEQVFDYFLDGDSPSYVDMPIWYTHNIKNIGEEELYTMFWINEPYNPDDPDTYFETA